MLTVLLLEWLEFAVRWLHVITGIAWIGSSFYFIALDLGLKHRASLPRGVSGEEWQVHGGGFYNVRKYVVAPDNLPEHVTWFKWESYSTWLSGFFLMAIVYYGGADLFLVDNEVAEIDTSLAIGVSVVSLLIGWILYNSLCKLLVSSNNTYLMIILFIILSAVSWGYLQIFSGRAAFLHLGAFTATIMTANVFFIIIPNQKIVVNDLKNKRKPDPIFGVIAKQRSTHNNYLTLPVIFFMISNHYPLAFGSKYNWLIAPLIFLMGVSIRHFFNTKHSGRGTPYWTWALTGVIFLLVIFLSSFRLDFKELPVDETKFSKSISLALNSEEFPNVSDIVSGRCMMCHAKEPLWDGFLVSPKGLLLESDAQIAKNAKLIYLHSGISRAMPPNNISYMEDSERRTIIKWFEEVNNK